MVSRSKQTFSKGTGLSFEDLLRVYPWWDLQYNCEFPTRVGERRRDRVQEVTPTEEEERRSLLGGGEAEGTLYTWSTGAEVEESAREASTPDNKIPLHRSYGSCSECLLLSCSVVFLVAEFVICWSIVYWKCSSNARQSEQVMLDNPNGDKYLTIQMEQILQTHWESIQI